MTATSRIRINTPSVASETIEQETVIINFDSGMYYSMNSVGAAIWLLIQDNSEQNAIVEQLAHAYNGDRTVISQAVQLFIDELLQQSLVVFSDESPIVSTPLLITPLENRPAFCPPVLNRYTDMAELLLLDPVHEIEDRWSTT